ncbi:MAG TPA: hypothetical protein VG013_15535, partial [Gemmataceae bacterium]|nr:hypothetical protein [Gemmataceae bacterium]
ASPAAGRCPVFRGWTALRLRDSRQGTAGVPVRSLLALPVADVQAERIVVHLDKGCHNPILREAALDRQCPGIPWLRNLPVVFEYP